MADEIAIFKQTIEKLILEEIADDLESDRPRLSVDDLPIISNFILARIDNCRNYDDFNSFLQELVAKYPVFFGMAVGLTTLANRLKQEGNQGAKVSFVGGGTPMYCSNCGTKLAENVRFCSSCGTPVQQTSSQALHFSTARTDQRAEIDELQKLAKTAETYFRTDRWKSTNDKKHLRVIESDFGEYLVNGFTELLGRCSALTESQKTRLLRSTEVRNSLERDLVSRMLTIMFIHKKKITEDEAYRLADYLGVEDLRQIMDQAARISSATK